MSEEHDSGQERTEAPSDKRRREFRERGEVAKSQELSSALMLLAGAGATAMVVHNGTPMLVELIGGTLGQLDNAHLWAQAPRELTHASLSAWARPLAAPFGLMLVAAIASNVGQIGFLWSPKALGFKGSRLNPVSGFKRLFASKDALANLTKTLAKVIFIGGIASWMMWTHASVFPTLVSHSPIGIASNMMRLAMRPIIACGFVMLVIGLAHFAWQRHSMEERMKTTREEAKREMKESEGDPHVKGRRKQLHRERLSANNLIETVPQASVIINNPTHYSVAIRYSPETGVPVVVAKGMDHRALRIRELAREHDVPMITSPPLARALHSQVDVGAPIPEQFFRAVAEILAWVMTRQSRRTTSRQR